MVAGMEAQRCVGQDNPLARHTEAAGQTHRRGCRGLVARRHGSVAGSRHQSLIGSLRQSLIGSHRQSLIGSHHQSLIGSLRQSLIGSPHHVAAVAAAAAADGPLSSCRAAPLASRLPLLVWFALS